MLIRTSAAHDAPDPAILEAPTRLVRRTGMEVRGNWIIDRDLAIVRRRFWGKVTPGKNESSEL